MVTQPRMSVELLEEKNIPRSRPDNKFFRTVVNVGITNPASPTILEVNVDGVPEVLLTDVSLAQINLRI